MVTRRVSEDFNGFLANASGYQNTQFQKLICPVLGVASLDPDRLKRALHRDWLNHETKKIVSPQKFGHA